MGLLDWIIGSFFLTNSGVCCRPFLAGAFFAFRHALLCSVPRRGVFLFLFLRHFLPNGHIWSTKMISGPDFLKNDHIWLDFIILDLFGSSRDQPAATSNPAAPRNASALLQFPDWVPNSYLWTDRQVL